MSAARRDWEKQLIATAALMGAVYEHVVIRYKSHVNSDGTIKSGSIMRWAVNLFSEEDRNPPVRAEFTTQWFAAYWYLVERHSLSFQNNGELIPCARHGGMMHDASNIRRHQSYTREAAWRKEQKNSSKFRRNFGRGHTVKAPSPTDT